MGRTPCCSNEGVNRGAWTAMEDQILRDHIKVHGEGKWRSLPIKAGLKRCGKSCRLRWLNYLRPDIKRGNITHEEEDLIIRLHKLLGNRWALIAGRLPGRTDNEIKNYWNTTLLKKVKAQQSTHSKNLNLTRAAPPLATAVHSETPTAEKVTASTPTQPANLAEAETPTKEDHSAANCEDDNYSAGKIAMDFDVGELLLSDYSDSEFWKVFQFENEVERGGDNGGDSLIFSEEMLTEWMRDGVNPNHKT